MIRLRTLLYRAVLGLAIALLNAIVVLNIAIALSLPAFAQVLLAFLLAVAAVKLIDKIGLW